MSTCTPAMVPSRKNPMTSAFKLRELRHAACRIACLSIRALIRPARSKSSSAAACCISSESSSTNSRWLPREKALDTADVGSVLLRGNAAAARPGPLTPCASKHGRTSLAMQASGSFPSCASANANQRSWTSKTAPHDARCRPCGERSSTVGIWAKYRVSARCFSRGI